MEVIDPVDRHRTVVQQREIAKGAQPTNVAPGTIEAGLKPRDGSLQVLPDREPVRLHRFYLRAQALALSANLRQAVGENHTSAEIPAELVYRRESLAQILRLRLHRQGPAKVRRETPCAPASPEPAAGLRPSDIHRII